MAAGELCVLRGRTPPAGNGGGGRWGGARCTFGFHLAQLRSANFFLLPYIDMHALATLSANLKIYLVNFHRDEGFSLTSLASNDATRRSGRTSCRAIRSPSTDPPDAPWQSTTLKICLALCVFATVWGYPQNLPDANAIVPEVRTYLEPNPTRRASWHGVAIDVQHRVGCCGCAVYAHALADWDSREGTTVLDAPFNCTDAPFNCTPDDSLTSPSVARRLGRHRREASPVRQP